MPSAISTLSCQKYSIFYTVSNFLSYYMCMCRVSIKRTWFFHCLCLEGLGHLLMGCWNHDYFLDPPLHWSACMLSAISTWTQNSWLKFLGFYSTHVYWVLQLAAWIPVHRSRSIKEQCIVLQLQFCNCASRGVDITIHTCSEPQCLQIFWKLLLYACLYMQSSLKVYIIICMHACIAVVCMCCI